MKNNGHGRTLAPKIFLFLLATGFLLGVSQSQAQTTVKTNTEDQHGTEHYYVIPLHNIYQDTDGNDIVTALRNMFIRAKIYYVPAQKTIVLRTTEEDFQAAKKIVSDLDKPRKSYRVSYSLTTFSNGKASETQHGPMLITDGEKTDFINSGSRIPITVRSEGNAIQTQYIDTGLRIEAKVNEVSTGVQLQTKLEKSAPENDKPVDETHLPIIQQVKFENTTNVPLGHKLVLGTVNIPGSPQTLEISVEIETEK